MILPPYRPQWNDLCKCGHRHSEHGKLRDLPDEPYWCRPDESYWCRPDKGFCKCRHFRACGRLDVEALFS